MRELRPDEHVSNLERVEPCNAVMCYRVFVFDLGGPVTLALSATLNFYNGSKTAIFLFSVPPR